MTFRLLYTPEAARAIQALDKAVKERVREAVERLTVNPEIGKPLRGPLAGQWSLRVGDWRVLYRIERREVVVLILTVGHRREVYG